MSAKNAVSCDGEMEKKERTVGKEATLLLRTNTLEALN